MSATVEKSVIVTNALGIHMRPADLLVRAASQFQSKIEILKDGQAADCRSILSILTLGAAQGTELSLRAEGDDAQQAVDALTALFEEGFNETNSEVASPGKAE